MAKSDTTSAVAPIHNELDIDNIIEAMDNISDGLSALNFLAKRGTLENGLQVILVNIATNFEIADSCLRNFCRENKVASADG